MNLRVKKRELGKGGGSCFAYSLGVLGIAAALLLLVVLLARHFEKLVMKMMTAGEWRECRFARGEEVAKLCIKGKVMEN